MMMIDFTAYLKPLNKLLKLMMPHPEDQEVLAKDDLRSIVIYVIPDMWQQEFERKMKRKRKE